MGVFWFSGGFFMKLFQASKKVPAGPQTADKHFPGGLEGPRALQSGFVSPGLAGRAGSLRPWAQTFLKHLAKKAAIGGLFRQTETLLRKASESTAHVAGFGFHSEGCGPPSLPKGFFDSLTRRL